jgi:trimeric autotransporter adhesin
MKRILSFSLALFSSILLLAQAPDAFKYQLVVRNNSGEPLVSQTVNFRISILQAETVKYQEVLAATTNEFGIANLIIGQGGAEPTLSTLDWSAGNFSLQTEIDPAGGTSFQLMGTSPLLSVPYAFYADKTNPSIDPGPSFPADSALFSVKDRQGNIVFAVYEDGVQVIANPSGKGGRGGFAVGSRSASKGTVNDLMSVTSDSIRFYLEKPVVKGGRGGFVVGGRSAAKGVDNEILSLEWDSVRVYIPQDAVKGGRGGFAVGGRQASKTGTNEFFRVTQDSVKISLEPAAAKSGFSGFIVSQNSSQDILRMNYLNTKITTTDTVDYFQVGSKTGSSLSNIIDLNTTNYFIGHESGKNIVKVRKGLNFPDPATHNVFIGYQAGKMTTSASDNVFMGYQAGLNNTAGNANILIGNQAGISSSGSWNVFLGNQSGYSNQNGLSNIFIGDMSGYNHTDGHNNVFMGKESGYRDVSSNGTVYIGSGAGYNHVSGNENTFLGVSAGRGVSYIASSTENTYLGALAGFANPGSGNTYVGNRAGIYSQAGNGNVYIGRYAGYRTNGSNNIIIGSKANYKDGITSTNFSNVVAIGDSVLITASNEVRLGNPNNNALFCYAAYNGTTTSAPNLVVSSTGKISRSTSNAVTGSASLVKVSVATDVGSVAAYSALVQTFAVTGAIVGSSVSLSPSTALPDGLIISYARVSAAGTVEAKFFNATGTAINPVSMTYYITAVY